mgnify:FL=1|jgi:hypothetical protein
MTQIKELTINTSPIPRAQTVRSYTVLGDVGACFTVVVKNEDDNFYNFPDNVSYSTKPSPTFASTPVQSDLAEINESGFYTGTIVFPTITDDDKYQITLIPAKDTTLAKSFSEESIYNSPYIYQYDDPVITFSVLHSNAAVVEPSNITDTGFNSAVGKRVASTVSLSFPITLSSSNFVIARQPVISDFEFTTTKDTRTSGSGTSLELKNIEGLSVDMDVSGTGIASNTTISEIHAGYYDAANSTPDKSIYIIPSTTEVVNGVTVVSQDKGGTVVLNNSSTFVADRTLTFTGKGPDHLQTFNGAEITFSNLSLTIDAVTTTTDSAVSNSTTIPITSTDGIKAADTVLMTGIGVTATSPHVDTVNAGVSVVVSSAQTIENGQTVTFTGSSRSASVTGNVLINSHGTSDVTLTLNLDNILTVE